MAEVEKLKEALSGFGIDGDLLVNELIGVVKDSMPASNNEEIKAHVNKQITELGATLKEHLEKIDLEFHDGIKDIGNKLPDIVEAKVANVIAQFKGASNPGPSNEPVIEGEVPGDNHSAPVVAQATQAASPKAAALSAAIEAAIPAIINKIAGGGVGGGYESAIKAAESLGEAYGKMSAAVNKYAPPGPSVEDQVKLISGAMMEGAKIRTTVQRGVAETAPLVQKVSLNPGAELGEDLYKLNRGIPEIKRRSDREILEEL